MTTFQDVFGFVETTAKILGFGDLFNNPTILTRIRAIYICGLINLIYYEIGELIFFFITVSRESDFNEMILIATRLLPCAIDSLYAIIKTFAVIFYRHAVIEVLEELKEMWPKSDGELKIAEEMMLPTKKFGIAFTITGFVLALFVSLTPPILSYYAEERVATLPLYIWFPYNPMRTKFLYWFHFFTETYAAIFVAGCMTCIDCVYCQMTAMLCVHLKIISGKLAYLGEKEGCTLKEIVDYHNKIIELAKKTGTIFGMPILATIVCSAIMLCLSTLALKIETGMALITNNLFLATTMMQILLICVFGQMLVDKSVEIGEAAYDSDWIGKDKSHTRGIIMILIRSSKPITLSACGFADVTLRTFSAVLSTSWSYFALLNTMLEDA